MIAITDLPKTAVTDVPETDVDVWLEEVEPSSPTIRMSSCESGSCSCCCDWEMIEGDWYYTFACAADKLSEPEPAGR